MCSFGVSSFGQEASEETVLLLVTPGYKLGRAESDAAELRPNSDAESASKPSEGDGSRAAGEAVLLV
jgi:hypothetical protein